MLTDGYVGSIGSSAGIAADLAVSLIGFVGNRPQRYAGQIWLPEDFNGQLLQTEEATEAMFTFVEQKITSVATDFGYEVMCLAGCNTKNQLFQLTRINYEVDRGYVCLPDTFTFSTNLGRVVPVEDNYPLKWLVGQDIAWKTPPAFTFVQEIRVNADVDERGIPKVYENNDVLWLKGGENLLITTFGRDFMLAFHSTPYTTYGGRWMHPNLFFYNGEIYSFYESSRVDFIRFLARPSEKQS